MISHAEQHGNVTLVAISDTGVSHRINHISNQDAVEYFVMDDDYMLAVSDGVGSCKKAEVGSKAAILAVKEVFILVKNKKISEDITEITDNIIAKWHLLLKGEKPNECCATLKAAMKLGSVILLFSIGDGILAISSAGMRISSPVESNLFTNQTTCLNEIVSAENIWKSVFKLDTQVPYVVFACSDGVANGIQEGREMELIEEIENGTEANELQTELENLLMEISEYSSDDRTVGVVKYERKNAKFNR